MASITRKPLICTQSSIDMGIPKLKVIRSAISIPRLPNRKLFKELNMANTTFFKKNNIKTIVPLESTTPNVSEDDKSSMATTKMYAILEVVSDRIEMHRNIGEQRENWNSLLLNSLNMITLTAATMAGLTGLGESGSGSVLALKVSATLLFSAATGILVIMNKIQPSQLVEEQRNAVRMFKQLQTRIQTALSVESPPTEKDVEEAMEKVLALDKAYPLPLLNGAMLDKFPHTFKPATWWPKSKPPQKGDSYKPKPYLKRERVTNGWSEELEEEMREIVGVIRSKDLEDYVNLGNKALKFNKMLAVSGPTLMGVAAVGSAFAGHGGPWAGLLAAMAGSLAGVVSTIEHGGQVGMVFEMYRNCGGFFKHLEESVESTLEEGDLERRENGELFEMKMALHLGRSLSELRDLAEKSSLSWLSDEASPKGEFASKLF